MLLSWLLLLSLTGKLSGSVETQVSYFSFVVNVPTDNFRKLPTTSFKEVRQADDSPFQRLSLPWSFNMLGSNVDELFVNPNGGLHHSPKQPCPSENYFASNVCGFNNSYFNVIGGYLTDLNPSKSPAASIGAGFASGMAEVSFVNVTYYNSTLVNTFRIRLYKDSHIEILYDKIERTSQFPVIDYWSSGLRGASINPYSHFTTGQIAHAKADWNTVVPSISPRQADVVTGKMFTMCPVARTWCMQPSTVSSSTLDATAVTFTTLMLSCTAIIDYAVLITNGTAALRAPCAVVNNSTTLHCDITTLLGGDLFPGNWTVTPAWSHPSSSTADLALPVEPLQLKVVEGTVTANECATNVATNSSCQTDQCALCTGNFTCLELPCANETTMELSSKKMSGIFDRLTCANTCPADNHTAHYFTDVSTPPLCCAEVDLDCSGRCGGPAVAALDDDGAVYCCPNRNRVDCAGVCDGSARRDMCGACQGTDNTGLGCFSSDDVVFSTESADNAWHPIFDVNASASGGLVRYVHLDVTNRNRFGVQVTLSESAATSAVAPVLTLPTGGREVGVNVTVSYVIPVSIELLYTGNITKWMAKTVTATFWRPSYPQAVYRHTLTLYPNATNCATVTDRSACIRLPACIFCPTSDSMRLLREREAHATMNEEQPEEQSEDQRRLFIEVIPPRVRDKGEDLTGVCGDGWRYEDCVHIAPYAYTSSGAMRSVPYLPGGTALLALVLIFLIS